MPSRLKKFLSYYKPYLGLLIADIACAFIVAAVALVVPLCVRYITKNIIEYGAADALGKIYYVGAIMLALAVIQGVCEFFYDYKGHAMGAMMERDMRNQLFNQYQRLSFGFFDEEKPGRLMSRITNDLLSLAELYHHGPEDIAVYLVKFVGAFVILAGTNLQLTLAVFAFLPVLAGFTMFMGKRLNAAFENNLEIIGDVNSQVEENISCIRIVKAYTNEEAEKKKFSFENNRFLGGRTTIYKTEAVFSVGVNTFNRLVIAAVAVFGGAGILKARLDLADLVTFLLYVNYLIEPVQRLAFVIKQYQEGIAGFNRFMDIMELAPEISDSQNAIELQNVKGRVEFRKVGFKYKEDHVFVLKDLSLTVEPGDYVAVVGYSGVGKTTLCSLIPRFYEASEGNVLVDGVDIKDVTLESLRRNVGVVHQETYLFAGTVLENIHYGNLSASRQEVIDAAQMANAHEFIMNLPNGYETDIGPKGVRLSGGQKQRISIARAFLKNPPILIMDEATSALDNESERVVQESLERLAKNRTTFIIAHRLSTIRNAKRIIVLSDNGIEEEGTHEELMRLNGTYAGFYNVK